MSTTISGTALNVATITSPTLITPIINGMGSSILTSGTAVASTSGTSIDFTGIPSWAKRITVMFNGVSTNGASNPLIQIGSGSVTATGYLAGSRDTTSTSAGGGSTYTTGFGIQSVGAVNLLYGNTVTNTLSGNIWASSSTIYVLTGSGYMLVAAGAVTLSGALDRVRITTVNSTDTFDAGSINILYE